MMDEERACSTSLSEEEKKKCMDKVKFDSWYAPQRELSGKKSDQELKKMGESFQKRGFTSGKVQFAVEFNKVKRSRMMPPRTYQGSNRNEDAP